MFGVSSKEVFLKLDAPPGVLLRVPAGESFLTRVTSFVEKTALILGLAKAETLSLTLATEEVFLHLCRVILPQGGDVEVDCLSGGYYVRVDFRFPARDFNLWAFNLTATVSVADEAALGEMGLVLASRSVDRFQLTRQEGQGMRLRLIKEKAYPMDHAEGTLSSRALTKFSVRVPQPEEMKIFSSLVKKYYQGQIIPDFLQYPGKLVDMMRGGEFSAAVALGPAGEIGGGILWHWSGLRMVECFGPYLFDQDPDSPIAGAALEACIGAIAKTPAVGLINRFPTPEFPRQHFESLGNVLVHAADESPRQQTAWFRQLHEDLGSVTWAHPALEDFLKKEYRRLVLPRDIRLLRDAGEGRSQNSVLAAEFDRLNGQVTLHPVWPGADVATNVAQHRKLLTQEGFRNIFSVVDLGQAWQADFAPAFLQNGFLARLVLPYAGEGDLVIFQFEGAGS
jgi:anti-sigma regulatory factor (Ser/Thr protein kinase)